MYDLSITQKQFKEYYPKIDLSVFQHDPANKKELLNKHLPSRLWRLNNLYTIVNKDGERIKFKMNKSQHKVYKSLLKFPRLIILKSRQQGISTFWLIFFFDMVLFNDDKNVGLMAQGKSEAATLLKRVKLAWSTLDDSIKEFLGIQMIKDNTEEVSFSNGSSIFIRTSFRSATLQGLHISEYGKIANKYPERAKETKTGTLQTIKPGNPVAIESTAEGQNDFKRTWNVAVDLQLSGHELGGKDYLPVFLSWLEDPDCWLDVKQPIAPWQSDYFDKIEDELKVKLADQQKWFWVAQYRELGDSIYQEYPSTPDEAFTAIKDGTYYAKLYREDVMRHNREVENLYDPNLPVHVAFDLGMNDTFTLLFFQQWKNEWRIIDEYTNSGEGLEHYVNEIRGRNYPIGTLYLPHDVRVRELSTGQSRLHRLRELGVRNYRVLPKIAVNDGIEAVRKIMDSLWVDSRCTYIIECFKNYSKEWDDKLGTWKNKPLHNEFSHGADAIRYMAIGTYGIKHVKAYKTRYTGVVDGLAL